MFAGPVPQRARDAAVVVVTAVPTIMDAWWNEVGTRQADAWTFAIAGASCFVLLWRHRWPVAVAFVCGCLFTVLYLMDHHGELLNLPALVALYSVASLGNRRRTIVIGLVAALWSGNIGYSNDDPAGARGGSPILEILVPVAPLALGEAARLRRQLVAEHAAQALRNERDRRRDAAHGIALERVRIARELHDIVAHTMSAVTVQMNVAAAAFDREPVTARTALADARASAKVAMTELRRSVAVLREDRDEPLAPVARLDDIESLATTARAAGIAVEVVDRRPVSSIPTTIDLAATRIVQEALTNVVRHSGAHHAVVEVAGDAERLVVVVSDDGAGTGGAALSGSGHGLVGMRERAEALGGGLDASDLATGGFAVRAELPLGGPE